MPKIIVSNNEASTKIKKGIDLLVGTVSQTLGPQGKNVIIEKKFGSPQVTKDGVTVAKEVSSEDPIENQAIQLVKDVASKTNDSAGDGTTTATVLAGAIYNAGYSSVHSGSNLPEMIKGMNSAVDAVVAELDKMSKPVESNSDIEKIATTSANNDKLIGSVIASAMDKVGKDGLITVEEAKSRETRVELVEGMKFDRGFLSPYFVTNAEKMIVELENPYVLISEKKISNVQEIIPLLEKVAKEGSQLFVIAEDVSTQVLSMLVVNKMRNILSGIAAVKSPSFGDRKKAELADIATLTGGQVVGSEQGLTLENIQVSQLGKVDRVTIDKDSTSIVGGQGNPENINTRIKELKAQVLSATSDYDKERIQERIAKLSKGVAKILIGGATEAEVMEKKDRVEDALNATRAAVAEGVLPGGGTALLRASAKALTGMKSDNEDEKRGILIISEAIENLVRKLFGNALGENYYPVFQKVKDGAKDFGYNIRTQKFGSLYEFGVIDPTKVTKLALINACSCASLLLNTSCVIADKPSNEESNLSSSGMPPMGGGMGGMM